MIVATMTRKKVMMKPMGTGLIIAGIVLIALGILFKLGWLSWLGNLPGDIRYEGEHTKIYVPITTMIVLSVVVSILIALYRKW
ncbi:MAG: DUF2905 domain-containing protein [Sulfurimonadaceae bacterium]|nr:DUF2905 domain-containing protein [Sulfurimonadaceae bacterium]